MTVVTKMRPCLVFPAATREGGVERAVWEGLRYFGSRYCTTFVGYEVEQEGLPEFEHRKPDEPRWGLGALGPAAFRVSARGCTPRGPGSVTASFGANVPPGDVFVVNSVHRAWLHRGHPVSLGHVSVPNAVRYLLPRHQILLALEWGYFRHGHPRAVVAVSRAVADELAELYGVPTDLVTVIPNGFDPAQCNPERRLRLREKRRAALGIPEDAVVLLFVANELHRKGLGVLLDAVARVRDESVEVHVVGRAPLHGYGARIAELGLSHRIRYHGATADIGLFHAIADLLVLPTQYEAFALTVVEALASGLPVITTIVPGAGDLVRDHVNGRLQRDPTDDEELGALLVEGLDRDRRKRWAEAAPDAVVGYEWPALMRRYEQVLLGAV
jgi:glycosyltransferase involved in cell wall biosynthesis